MILKIRSVALVLLLIILSSGIVMGDDGDKTLFWITIKKIEPNIGNVGHYWIEMLDENGKVESYGWYPSADASDWELLKGAPGELNGIPKNSIIGGFPHDPHELESADNEIHPKLTNSLTDKEVRDKIRYFSNSYSGNWALFTRNCHTFIDELMKYVGLVDPNPFSLFVSTAYAPSDEIGTPKLSKPTSYISSNEGSGVSGTSSVSQTGNPRNDNYILKHLPPCDCNWPTIDPRPPRDGDWMYNKNDGKYYTTYGGYYWLYDENDPALVDGYSKSLNPFPGSPPRSTPTSVAGVGLLIDEGQNGGGGW